MIIAVDGPAASGKGTLARRLAGHFGLAYLDTGRTYRGVAAAMLAAAADLEDAHAAVRAAHDLDFEGLGTLELGTQEIGEGASRLAVIPELRAVLVKRQRGFAEEALAAGSGAVLDGRDIGTVVCPDAAVKLFVTASAQERARRRALELYGEAEGPRYRDLVEALELRDRRDRERAASPLRPADDAHVLDTTHLSADEAFFAAVRLVDKALAA
ncbi:(d)CMP kinase [Acuticoccus mangrovi]|uniref:Cytidylate kinase n=1 Tax=Acuticoccus mangrovi TaxID=2796142 RepID=A0A934INW7_9HYPH|nr:(d)CMP kinase [Acuticoccus mangrovi]